MKPKISIITLGVKDFEKSLKFYRDGLGFKPHNYKETDGYAMFEMEGSWLAIMPKSGLAKDANINMGEGLGGFTLAHNVSTETQVDVVFDFAVKAGATAIKKPEKVFWGGYSGYFADPDGYLWEIAYNPFTDLT